MQIYDFTVTTNGTFEIAALGNYVYYYSGSAGGADPTILLKHDVSGTTIRLMPGQGFTMDSQQQPGGRWLLTNSAGAATITGRLVVGKGQIQDNRVTGAVEIIDGGKNRTLGGSAFMTVQIQTAVAAQYPTIQWWNPPGSGKNMIIEKFSFSSSTAQQVRTGWNNVAISATNGVCVNKKAGGATGVVVANYTTLAGLPGGFNYLQMLNVSANTPVIAENREPIVIPSGYGFCITGNLANSDLTANIEFFEESAA